MKILVKKELIAYSKGHQCPSCQSTYLLEQEDITTSWPCPALSSRKYHITCPVCEAYLEVTDLADYQKRAIIDGKTLPKRKEEEPKPSPPNKRRRFSNWL